MKARWTTRSCRPSIYKQAVEAAPQIEDDGFVFTLDTVPGGFYFNYSIPPWNDVTRVRQALSLAMDRDGVIAATNDTGPRRLALGHLAAAALLAGPQGPEQVR